MARATYMAPEISLLRWIRETHTGVSALINKNSDRSFTTRASRYRFAYRFPCVFPITTSFTPAGITTAKMKINSLKGLGLLRFSKGSICLFFLSFVYFNLIVFSNVFFFFKYSSFCDSMAHKYLDALSNDELVTNWWILDFIFRDDRWVTLLGLRHRTCCALLRERYSCSLKKWVITLTKHWRVNATHNTIDPEESKG